MTTADTASGASQREIRARGADARPTALYRLYGRTGELLYVGVTMDMAWRWKEHARNQPWWREVVGATIEHFSTRREALEAERVAIQTEHPRWNVQHRLVAAPAVADVNLDLDALGRRHARLQKRLKEHRERLAPAIREEYERGATIAELLRRSGYHSPEAVRQIIDPDRRERFNRRRRGDEGQAEQ